MVIEIISPKRPEEKFYLIFLDVNGKEVASGYENIPSLKEGDKIRILDYDCFKGKKYKVISINKKKITFKQI